MAVIDAEAVRSWARDEGIEVGRRGRIPADVVSAWEVATGAAPPASVPPPGDTTWEDETPDGPAPGEQKPKRTGFSDRFKRAATSKVSATPGKRVSAEDILGTTWQLAATGLIMSGADPPVGRVMMLQAPAAGALLDTALAGTLPDRLLIQPMAKAGARGANLGALLGPPLIVGLIERQPHLYQPLKPILKSLLTAYLVETWPQVKKMRETEEKARQVLSEMAGEDMPDIDSLLDSLFPDPAEQGPRLIEDDGYVPEGAA
jgi:Lsr2